jgi:predicted permease
VAEALVLGAMGGGLGLVVGQGLLELAKRIRPSSLRMLDDIALGPTVIAVAVGVSLVAVVALGLAPIWAVSRSDAADTIVGRQRRASDGLAARRLRGALVVGQLAISIVLLVGSGLLARSYLRAHRLPLGLDPQGLGHVWFELPEKEFPNRDHRAAVEREILASAAAVPGIRRATLGQTSPLDFGVLRGEFLTDQDPWPAIEAPVMMPYRAVSADFFAVAGIPLLAGRAMAGEGSSREMVIDESTARRHWPNRLALGERVKFGRQADDWRIVVGVVADQRIVADAFGGAATLYVGAEPGERSILVARFDRQDALANAAAAVGRVNGGIRIRAIVTAEEALSAEFAVRKFSMALVVSFAVLSLLLAAVGLYGAIAMSVAQRTFEIGVRMSLGATPGRVTSMMVREGVARIAVALTLGAVGVAAVAGAIRASLYRSSPWDPTVFGLATGLLGAVALVAVWLPARRASRVDPLLALRSE